jgi:radical SAM superfamily enzyme YgiQ (UPF0313 family)
MSGEKHLVLATIEDGVRALTIRVLGAYAESLGVRTTLLYVIKPLATIGNPVTFSPSEVKQVARFFERERVTHFGVYLMTATLKPYRLLAKALRESGYKGVIVAGGVHATLCPEESLVEGADFAVQGLGEVPLKLIFDGADPATIPGLVWRKDGALTVNPQSPEQKIDLDALPFPLFRFGRDKALLKGKLRRYTWRIHREYAEWHGKYYDMMTSRGCPNRCAYCCNVNRGAIRRQSVDRVIRELLNLREQHPQIDGVNIQDDAFFYGPEDWVTEFCRRMKDEVGLPFIIRMIPRYVTPQRIELFKAGGCDYVTMGLESSDRVNRTVFKRHEDKASFLKAAKAVLKAGLYLSIDVIVHNPYETAEDLREVAETLNALPRPNWGIVNLALTPFPNTPIYERAVQDRMLKRFATDAYDSMLIPSREGAYLTPPFWHTLITRLLPVVDQKLGAKLIAAGPGDPKAVEMVERLDARIERARRITAWLRDKTPWLYRLLLRLQRRMGAKASREL